MEHSLVGPVEFTSKHKWISFARRYRFGTGKKIILISVQGGADLDPKHPYYEALANIFAWILKANDNGIYFPLWVPPISSFPQIQSNLILF